MFHSLFRTLLAATLFSGALAAADSGTQGRKTDELMHKSGLWTQVGQFQAQVRSSALQARAQEKASTGHNAVSEEDFVRVTAAMTAAFAPDTLRKVVAKEMARSLSPDDETNVLEWLSSELGQRITAIEEKVGEDSAAEKKQRDSPEFIASIPKPRLEKCRRLADSVGIGRATADMMINIATAVVYGAAATTHPVDADELKKVRRKFEVQRPQIEQAMTERAIAGFAYSYQSLSDEELERYVAFAESPSGRRYHSASLRAFDKALTGASLDMGKRLGGMSKVDMHRDS